MKKQKRKKEKSMKGNKKNDFFDKNIKTQKKKE